MHRIDTSTAQKDKFGVGENGFTIGDPQSGTPATEVSADILDAWQEEICAVVEGSGLSLDKTNNRQLLLAIKKLASNRYFSAGQALPVSNIGPVWHDDYGGWMHWQEFTQNGADYHGYASQGIGSLLLDTQPTPRQGYIKSGVQNLSRTTYAALRAWALHHGRMVAPATWQAGQIVCADNADGTTFRVYDVRGEFLRVFDDGRGADPSRAFGSWQKGTAVIVNDTYEGHILAIEANNANDNAGVRGSAGLDSGEYTNYNNLRGIYLATTNAGENDFMHHPRYGGGVARPRNTALLATIKY